MRTRCRDGFLWAFWRQVHTSLSTSLIPSDCLASLSQLVTTMFPSKAIRGSGWQQERKKQFWRRRTDSKLQQHVSLVEMLLTSSLKGTDMFAWRNKASQHLPRDLSRDLLNNIASWREGGSGLAMLNNHFQAGLSKMMWALASETSSHHIWSIQESAVAKLWGWKALVLVLQRANFEQDLLDYPLQLCLFQLGIPVQPDKG